MSRLRKAPREPGADEKLCPFCAETIKAAAIRCRFCQSELPQDAVPTEATVVLDAPPAPVTPAPVAPAPVMPAPVAPVPFLASARLLRILLVTLVLLLVAGTVVAFTRGRPPALTTTGPDAARVQLTEATARDAGLVAATELTEKALSYKWNTLDADISGAEAGMTATFRKEYSETMAKVKQKTITEQVVLKASVVATGIVSASDSEFKALAFVNQATTVKGAKDVQLDQSRVLVTLTRTGGDWHLSRLDAF